MYSVHLYFSLRVFYVPPTVQHTSCTGVTAILCARITVSSSMRLVSTKQWCKTCQVVNEHAKRLQEMPFVQTSDAAGRRWSEQEYPHVYVLRSGHRYAVPNGRGPASE